MRSNPILSALPFVLLPLLSFAAPKPAKNVDVAKFARYNYEAEAIEDFDKIYKDSVIESVTGIEYVFNRQKFNFIENLIVKHKVKPVGFLEHVATSFSEGFVCGVGMPRTKTYSPECKPSTIYSPNELSDRRIAIAKLIMEKGERPSERAIVSCVGLNELELCKTFISTNNNQLPDQKACEDMLLTAVSNGYIDFVKYLIERGVSPDATEGDHFYAIFRAVERPEVFFYLIEKGAKYTHEGYKGTTALQHAAREGCLEVIQFFIDKKVDPNEIHGNSTAMEMAKKYNYTNSKQVISLLKTYKP